MIDRTTFDLRIADHAAHTTLVNLSDWQHGQPTRRPIRATLANLLVFLAARLDPAAGAASQPKAATLATPA